MKEDFTQFLRDPREWDWTSMTAKQLLAHCQNRIETLNNMLGTYGFNADEYHNWRGERAALLAISDGYTNKHMAGVKVRGAEGGF